jgi:pilus assembly protein CpaD
VTHRIRPNRGILGAGLGCALALLAGCGSPNDDWQPGVSATQKTNEVEFSRIAHTVRFQSGASAMSPAETQSLAAFLDEADVFYGDHVYLAVASNDGLAQKRQAAMRRTFAKRGVLVSVLPTNTGLAHGDEVVVQLERAVVTSPRCPDWSKPPGGDPTTSVGSNFGCATTTNLGLMVAQPRDLLVGRQPGPADAEPGLAAIQNYRAHKPIVLPDDLSGNSAPSASGAGNTSSGSPGASGSGG